MDKLINKHIDTLEELESELDIIVEDAIASIDIEALVKNPTAELERVVEEVKEVFLKEYAPQAVEAGIDFAKKIQERIEQDKDIIVDKSKDPNLNKDENKD